MKNFLTRANKKLTFGWAAALLSGSFLISALLGLLRDRLLIANFGLGPTLDAYYIAFSIPDFIFYLLISGALSVTFIPVLSKRLVANDRKGAWDLSSSLLNLLGFATLFASVVIIIFAPQLVKVIASGSEVHVQNQAADLMRIVAVNPFLFGLGSVLSSMQQAFGRFFFNAMAPVVYNLGIITGIIVFGPKFGIKGVALGVALGAIAQLIVQGIGMLGLGFHYTPVINRKSKSLREVLRALPARSFDQGIDHLIAIIERFVASFLFAGAIASYQAAFTLRNVPITLIGAAIATAAFPTMSELANGRADRFKAKFIELVRLVLWLAIPSMTIAFIMRGYLTRLLLGSGSSVVALLLGWMSISIVFRTLFQLATRAFYSHHDTRTPLYVSIGTLALNGALAYWLASIHGISGLAMAQSFTAMAEVTILFILLERRFGRFFTFKLWKDIGKMVISATGMAIITYALIREVFPLFALDTGFFTLAPKFIFVVISSLLAYVIFSAALNLREVKPIILAIQKIVFKPVKIE